MPGLHVRDQEDGRIALLVIAQAGHPFGRLPVLHLAVVEARGDQQRRIGGVVHVVVGGIGQHPEVGLLFLGVAPLVELAGGQGNAVVEHGGHHVHEGHLGHRGAPQVGTQVQHRTHQQTTGAPAHAHQAVRVGVTLPDQVLPTRDEVGEGVHLMLHAPLLIPRTAQVLAAPDVRQREHEATVQEAQPRDAEGGFHADAVGAVAVQQQRGLAVQGHVAAVHHRDGHTGAVRRGGPGAFAGVVPGIEVAQHLLLLQEGVRAGVHVVQVHALRGGEGGVAVAQLVGVPLGIGARPGHVGGVLEADLMLLPVAQAADTDVRKALTTFAQHQVVAEQVHVLQAHILAMRDHFQPL